MTNISKIKPRSLSIDISSQCQLACPTCPTQIKNIVSGNEKGFMSFDGFRKILLLNPEIKNVSLECTGELFLNPDLHEILKYSSKNNIRLYASSGSILNHAGDGILEAVAMYKLWSLVCSIDGATEETYRIYRKKGNFNKVIEHIRQINSFKKNHGSFPRLAWQFVVFGHNEHEIDAAKTMAKKLNMDFYVKMQWETEFSPIVNKEYLKKKLRWKAFTRQEFLQLTKKDYMRSNCYSLWKYPLINIDGTLLGCCRNTGSAFGGNAFETEYLKLVNSPLISKARNVLLGINGVTDDIPCKECILYQNIIRFGNFLTLKEVYRTETKWYRIARFLYKNMKPLSLMFPVPAHLRK